MSEKRTIDDASHNEWEDENKRQAESQSAGTVPEKVETTGVAAVAAGSASASPDKYFCPTCGHGPLFSWERAGNGCCKCNETQPITLTEADVESAIRAFVCACRPDLAVGWRIDVRVRLLGGAASATAWRTRNPLNNMKTPSVEGIREQQPHAGRSLWAVVGRFFRRPPAPKKRKVLLIDFDSEIKIVEATKCEAGWLARWHQLDTKWLILLPDGKIEGQRIRAWKPYEGWNDAANQ